MARIQLGLTPNAIIAEMQRTPEGPVSNPNPAFRKAAVNAGEKGTAEIPQFDKKHKGWDMQNQKTCMWMCLAN